MSKHQQKLIQPLTGEFLGWGDNRIPHRYIKLATTNGQQVVKVAKSLRSQIQDWQPGVWLTLLGQQRVNLTTGETKIKVKQLLTPPRVINSIDNSLNPLPPLETIEHQQLEHRLIVPTQIRVCQGSSCRRKGSEGICTAMQTYFDRHDLTDRVEIKTVKCLHQCKTAPHAIFTHPDGGIQPEKTHYRQLQHYQVKAILMQHFPLTTSAESIGYNLIGRISTYLRQQIRSASTAL